MPSGIYIRTIEQIKRLKKVGFQKGHPSCNKGFNKGNQYAKGNPPNKTSFKKGHIPWSKNKKGICLNTGRTHFKKGQRGKECVNWKGGKKVNTQGYILIYKPEHPFCNKQGYVRRSHLIMENIIGRYFKKGEMVHHKGLKYPLGSIENRQDDKPKNLKLFPNNSTHIKFHHKLKQV